mgnify:CR=1 FL=1
MSVVTQFKPTFQESEGKAFLDYARRFEITPDDLATGVYYVPIEPGETVLEVRAWVDTLFDGTLPTVTVGDAASADGFLKDTDLDITTANEFARSLGKGASADIDTTGGEEYTWVANDYASGKYYAAASALTVTFAGLPTVGKLVLAVVFDGYGAGPDRLEIKNLS